MNLSQSAEIRDKEYRHGLVAAQVEIDLPLQLRALRKQRGWTQPELAERTGMKQSRFPLMERPGGARFTLETLRRLAEAFDVALIVRFAPFSELFAWSRDFNPDSFTVPSFEDEYKDADTDRLVAPPLDTDTAQQMRCLTPSRTVLRSAPQGDAIIETDLRKRQEKRQEPIVAPEHIGAVLAQHASEVSQACRSAAA